MGTLQIDILGTSFAVKSDKESEYLNRLLGYYRRLASQIQEKTALRDNLQVSILTGLMMCDKLYDEQSKNARMKNAAQNEFLIDEEDETTKITKSLIEKLDRVL
ncbi:MAG: cell division protein ZapA [Treponema sp.]